jgi:hypothetical protein
VFLSTVSKLGRDGGAGVHESADADVDESFGSTYSDWISRLPLRPLLCFWSSIAVGATDLKLFIAMKKTAARTNSRTMNPNPPPCRLMPAIWDPPERPATQTKKQRQDAPGGQVCHLSGR